MSFLTGRSVADFDNIGADVTPPAAEMSSPPSASDSGSAMQQVMFGVIAAGVGGYIVYNVWQNGRRTPTQRLNWAAEETHDDEVPQVYLVNFPDELLESMTRATKTLLGNVKLVPAHAVMYDASGDALTPGVVGGAVRQSTCAAFQQLGGKTPCVCYGEALAVGGESVNLFRSVDEVLRDSDRQPYLHRHCLGFTVDGSNVELFVHDVQGDVRRERYHPTTVPEDAQMCRNELAVRACFSPSAFTFEEDRVFAAHCSVSESVLNLRSTKGVERQAGKVNPSINTVWNSALPLFALFGAVARHNSATTRDEDSWYPLANRVNGGRVDLAKVGALRFVPPAITRALQKWIAPSHPRSSAFSTVDASLAAYYPRLLARIEVEVRHDEKEMRELLRAAFPELEVGPPTHAGVVPLELKLPREKHYLVPEAMEVLFHQAALVATVGGAVTRLALHVVVERLVSTDSVFPWPRDPTDRELHAAQFSPAQYFVKDLVKVSDAVAFAWLRKSNGKEGDSGDQSMRFVLAEFEC